jgi:hypothetical protein
MIEGYDGILDRMGWVVRLADVLRSDTLLFRDITGGRRADDECPRGRSQVLQCSADSAPCSADLIPCSLA